MIALQHASWRRIKESPLQEHEQARAVSLTRNLNATSGKSGNKSVNALLQVGFSLHKTETLTLASWGFDSQKHFLYLNNEALVSQSTFSSSLFVPFATGSS